MTSLASKHILVTGGAGYIGSHTVVQLLQNDYKVTVIDSLVNANPKSLDRVREIVGDDLGKNLSFVKVDLVNKDELDKALAANAPYDACIHFAGLKAVGESVKLPLLYYHNNLTGTFFLIETMKKYGCQKIVFSSSATVYGTAAPPLTESSQAGVGITNPYGRTKFMLEEVFRDVVKSDDQMGVVLLRYFNPVGAHPSGKIGESPNGIPNNLMPYVQQVAVGRREKLTVFGDDYETHDGTGVRDYIHVQDLAAGHLAALKKLDENNTGCFTFNLGTGTGYSVLDMVKAMEKASGKSIPYTVGPRRAGDLASVYCNPIKAKEELGWTAKLGLDEMCEHAWKWQSIVIGGFSQGAALAIASSLRFEKRIAGFFALSGWALPTQNIENLSKTSVNNNVPIFIGHGTSDPVVLYENAEQQKKYFEDAKFEDITFKSYSGMGHSSCNDETKDLLQWLARVLPSQ
eukprot:g12819.t1